MFAIRLPEDIEAGLENLARPTGRGKTVYARQAILDHVMIWKLSISPRSAGRLCNREVQTAGLDEAEAELG